MSDFTAFNGMRGTGDWSVDGQRPKNWRETMLLLYPNGELPLTGLMSKFKSESTDDPEFNWYTKTMSHQTVSLSAAATLAFTSGSNTTVTLADTDTNTNFLKEVREGHQLLIRDDSSPAKDVNTKVVEINRATRALTLKALQTAGSTTYDRLAIIGSINAEGAGMTNAVSYDPVKHYNFTQIFRTSLEITRTARKTRLRTGDAYQEAKREALMYHGIEMEKALMFGVRSESTGTNGKPERTSAGLFSFIKDNAPTNVKTFADGTYDVAAGDKWIDAGEDFLDAYLTDLFRYGSKQKLAVCGTGALMGINKLVKARGDFQFLPTTKVYGITINRWVTPFGEINLMTHPLFSWEAATSHSMLLFEPENVKYRYIDDTTFFGQDDKKVSSSNERIDGTKEEFLTEAGYEYHHPISWGILHGIGKDVPA